MTLILTIANQSGIHQSSDYQLTRTDGGKPFSDDAGAKQLEANFYRMGLQLAFTGVAVVGSGRRTIDWLSDELKKLPFGSTLQIVCNVLARRCAKEIGANGVLVLVLAASALGRSFSVATISNAEWGRGQYQPKVRKHFRIQIRRASKPFHLISGYRDCVTIGERQRLKALSRDTKKSPEEIRGLLGNINAVASANSKGSVSKACWVGSQFADGELIRSQMHSTSDETVGSVPAIEHGQDMVEWVKKNFRAAPGQEIRRVQAARVMVGPGGGTPIPPPEGPAREFKFSGSPIAAQLRSQSNEHCGSLQVNPLPISITARRNEETTVQFSVAELTIVSMCADFSRPLLPWPQICCPLEFDGVTIPRGWEYSVCFWVEGGVYRLLIPQTSRGVRNLAFLGSDDELVIAVNSCEMNGKEPQIQSATLTARVHWRSRMDGSHG